MTALIDLIVVTYNAPEETEAFFGSLDEVGVPYTLTVWDNASPDLRTRGIVKRYATDEVKLVLCEENVGYARAANEAASWGRAPYLAVLNADTKFRTGVAASIIEAFESDEGIGVIGPRTVSSDGRLTHAGIILGKTDFEQRFWREHDRGQGADVMDVPTVSGATFFVRRRAWEEVAACPTYQDIAPGAGLLLPTRHYYEETYACHHVRQHGWRVLYLGSATMVHEWGRSTPRGGMRDVFLESRETYLDALRAHGMLLPSEMSA